MRTFPTVLACLAALACLAFVPTPARAAPPDSRPDPRALVDRAIQVLGGEDKLARLQAFHRTGRGRYLVNGQSGDFLAEWHVRYPDRLRAEVRSEKDGAAAVLVKVLAGDRGWQKLGQATAPLDLGTITEEGEQLYAAWVASLTPLKDPAFTLDFTGEAAVLDRPALGVTVRRKGRRDVALFFDKEHGWPVMVVSSVRAGGRELTQDVLFQDYQDDGGVFRPRRSLVRRDGKPVVEIEITALEPLTGDAAKLFTAP